MVTSVIRAALAVLLVLAMLAAGFVVLVLAGLESGPVAFGLAVLLALLPVPLYLAAVLFIDRFEPEPLPMIVLAFAWGATIAAFAAIVLNTIGGSPVGSGLPSVGLRAAFGSAFRSSSRSSTRTSPIPAALYSGVSPSPSRASAAAPLPSSTFAAASLPA